MLEVFPKVESVVLVITSPDPHGCSQEGVKGGEKVCWVAGRRVLAGNWQVVVRRKLRTAPLF